jgi:hypothetical protein
MMRYTGFLALIVGGFGAVADPLLAQTNSPAPLPSVLTQALAGPSAFAITTQVNVDGEGKNIPGNAANEPSLCVDPSNPERMAIGWRQFDSVTSDARQAGWAYSTNGGLNWTFAGVLETNVFRSDPVLAADPTGRFYYLSVQQMPFRSDLWTSTDGGAAWEQVGPALGGDKPWIVIDTTSSSGRGNLYQSWSPVENTYGDRIFSRSTDGGRSWSDPISIPAEPFWGTLDVDARGWLYLVGWSGSSFWVNRSTNASDPKATLRFDLTSQVNLDGGAAIDIPALNPEGLIGQPWIAVDRSAPTGGNVYVLCSVLTPDNHVQVMFARSTDAGQTWSPAQRLNDDLTNTNAAHWFGTLAVAPNGRVDACWYDTRNSPASSSSELFYANSYDGGVTWSSNRAISAPFNHSLGYPVQRKIGDYITMTSLEDRVYIAYAATFNREEDIFFRRIDFPVITMVSAVNGGLTLSWKAAPGAADVVQFKDNLIDPWSPLPRPVVADGAMLSIQDPSAAGSRHRFYRVVRQL